jgi:hypothetical protein
MIRIIAIVVSVAALGVVAFLLFSKGQRPWGQLTEEEKRKKKIMVASGFTVMLAGIITAILAGKKK